MFTIDTVPKDQDVLLYGDGGWYQGRWSSEFNMWSEVTLAFHGCGCCSGSASTPGGWLPLPSTEIERGPETDTR